MSVQSSRRRVCGAVLTAVAATTLVTGCGSSESGSAADRTLVSYTGQSGDYQINFNPFSSSTMEGPGTIFEPLFFYNITQDAKPVPLLGTDFAWNADGTRLLVTLRPNVKFSDGTPFTAQDVAFTLDMVAKNKTINTTGYDGEAVATDDTHVRITFPKPAFMQGPQVLGKTFIVPRHLWSKIPDPANDVIAQPVGTGPFVLEEFKPQAFTFKANPGYWGGEPAVKRIRYLALAGNQSGADALAGKQIDWQTGPVPDIKDVAKNYPGYQAITIPMNQMNLTACSNAALGCAGPQTDPAVRKAIHYAINRTQLNSLAFEDTASDISPGFTLLGRDAKYVSPKLQEKLAPKAPDLARSAGLLLGAGYAKGPDGLFAKDGKPLELTVQVPSGWTDYITAITTMTQQLQPAGIKLLAQQVSYNEWADARVRGRFQLLIDAMNQGPSADPFYDYNYYFSTETTAKVGESAYPNYSRYSNPEVDAALNAVKGIDSTEAAKRQPYFDVVQTRVEQDMPYIPILTGGTTSEYHSDKFTGWPAKDNLYAFPAVWSRPDQAQIYKTLKPVGR
ncbi:ABC transporter substrate-binding protein [Amycolatopsis sp. NPDC051045]|uniref:ABC transporter substrate-binding protein n=1 Tax=Amycolatopsis sp. NPDC051045 TaxID=3156922 RepID=UPI00342613C8